MSLSKALGFNSGWFDEQEFAPSRPEQLAAYDDDTDEAVVDETNGHCLAVPATIHTEVCDVEF